MRLLNYGLALKLALRPWKKSPAHAILSCLSVGSLIFLSSLLVWLSQASKMALKNVEESAQVIAFIRPDLNEADKGLLVEKIRMTVGARSIEAGAIKVKNGDRQAFIEKIKEVNPDLAAEISQTQGALGEGVDKDSQQTQALVPHYITIEGNLEQGVLDKVRALAGVDDANDSVGRNIELSQTLLMFQKSFKALALLLILVSFFGVFQLTRLHRYSQLEMQALLLQLGANQREQLAPSFVSGLITGLISGLFGALLWFWITPKFPKLLEVISPVFQKVLEPDSGWAMLILCSAILMGSASGLFGLKRQVRDASR